MGIKQQKVKMDYLSIQNDKLQQQVSKLFLTVRTLGKNNKQNTAKDAEIQNSLKGQFLILKNVIIQKDDHIKKLSHSLEAKTKDLHRKKKEIIELNESLNEMNAKYEDEKAEFEDTIQKHLDSIKQFNSTMNSLQSAMDSKENEMNDLKERNEELDKLLDEREIKMEEIVSMNDIILIENQEKDTIICKLNEKIHPLQDQLSKIKSLYQESIQGMEEEQVKYNEMMTEKEWWKNEAVKLEKECDFSVNELHRLKSELNSIANNKYKQNNIDVWKKRCYESYWRRFAEYEAYQYSFEPMRDVWMYLKAKYMKLNPAQPIEQRESFKDSFKISMFKSLKDIKNIDIDQLLLCQDPMQLTKFLLSSNMSQETQLRVAAQLLPVVEEYRINLQKDINQKVDKFIKKSVAKKAKQGQRS